MAIERFFRLIFVLLILLMSSSQGFKFNVGGKDGWVLNPSESYSHWAERNRFQVNDTLLFKFNKGNDSVLVVTRENYNECNVKTPIKSLSEGQSEYKFERSGPHYFISGNKDHCNKGQKLIVVVLAVRPQKSPPTPTPAVAPTSSPPTLAPASSAPASSPSAADAPSSSTDRSFALSVSTLVPNFFLSVAIGVGVFSVGGFNN